MFRQLFERSSDAVWLLEPDTGRVRECNQAAVNWLGASAKSDLIGKRLEDFSPPCQSGGVNSNEKANEVIRMALLNGSCRFEWVCHRSDGSELPLEVVVTSVPKPPGPLLLAVTRDITDRKRESAEILRLNETLEQRVAERTGELLRANELLKREVLERRRAEVLLRESEERARTLVEHAPEAIVVFDGDNGRFLDCNKNAAQLYGLPREQLIGQHPAELSPLVQGDGRLSIESARAKIQEALDGGTPVFEWLHRHASGHLITCEVRLVRLPAQGRNLIRGSITDTTERQRRDRVQQATYAISEAVHTVDDLDQLYQRIHWIVKGLMPADNFYIALLDQESGLISFPYHVDEFTPRPAACQLGTGLTGYVFRYGKPLLVNEAMNARKRRVGDMVTFEGFSDILYAESGVPAAIWLGVPLKTGGRTFGVTAVQDYHNPKAYGEAEKQLLSFVAEQIAQAIQRKAADQELHRALAKEKELGQLRSSFVSMVSHEFRTPLGVIQSSAEILEDYFEHLAPEERREHLVSIKKNTTRMASLMEEVLLLGRFDAGKMDFAPGALDLENFVRRVVEEVTSATGRRCPLRMGRLSIAPATSADERLLGPVLTNLLSNAIKYSHPGEPVELAVSRDDDHAVFAIRDHGLGIPGPERQWLFEPFHRGSNVGSRPGTGLGLVIAKRCVDLHGGSIEIDSTEGQGTTAVVRLPVYRATEESTRPGPQVAREPDAASAPMD